MAALCRVLQGVIRPCDAPFRGQWWAGDGGLKKAFGGRTRDQFDAMVDEVMKKGAKTHHN